MKAFNGEAYEEETYSSFLEILQEKVPKWALYAGIGTGLFFFVQYLAFSYGAWYGVQCVGNTSKCTSEVAYTPGETNTIFFSVAIGCYNFMPLLPNIAIIFQGMKAANRLYKIIDQ